MTAFEIYLEKQGFELLAGKRGDFNTYNNCSRSWQKDNKRIQIWLYAQPTRIGIFNPIIDENGKLRYIDYLPKESEYEQILNSL
jgi:hypothetical protein